ncbi:MAG: phosphate ABC transporter substrate-binding protein [Cyanobacteria bacterium J06638_28]
MKNIPKILLRTYFRQHPANIRLARFNFLARYSWLQNLLEDLRPELFPSELEPEVEEPPVDEREAEAAAQLIDAQVRGRQGLYQVESWIGRRGQGNLFNAVWLGAQQPVVLKEFLLPGRSFNPTEARQRQQKFVNLAGLGRTDGRSQDLRVIPTLDAIADTYSAERCYLITDVRDAAPTLRQQLRQMGPLHAIAVRQVLEQVLQTLLHLHQQATLLPSGQRQFGMVHGNLSLDSLLWVSSAPNQGFVYLADLALWERLFDPPTATPHSVDVTAATVSQDLTALGRIGYALLTGQETLPTNDLTELDIPKTDPYLANFIERLLTPNAFISAEVAWRELLLLPTLTLAELEPVTPTVETETQRRVPRWLLVLAGLLALTALGTLLWRFLWREQAPAGQMPQVCCFEEVGAVPTGEYTYTAIVQGTWNYVLAQRNLGQRGQTLESAIQLAQPELILNYVPAASVADTLIAVQTGAAEFAVMPRFPDLALPSDLGAEVVAYDGLAVLVPFSYAERQRGLPQALQGELTLQELNDIYVGKVDTWNDLSRNFLGIKRYGAESLETVRMFEQTVIDPLSIDRLPALELQPTFPMLRSILQDFETQNLGSIGIAPLSQVFGQCSVYPLALAAEREPTVQPLILNTGEPITPAIDLCDRKGVYFPDPEALQSGTYPLAYEIIVVFPQDNSRVPVGQKFIEMLRTTEGQQLLREAGLVPLNGVTP